MMSAMCNMTDTVTFSRGEMTELVRGRDEDLMRRVAPLVRQHDVALDLRDVERIDAAGIAALISLYGNAQETGHRFTVSNASSRVTEILGLVGLDRILLAQNAVEPNKEHCLERPAA